MCRFLRFVCFFFSLFFSTLVSAACFFFFAGRTLHQLAVEEEDVLKEAFFAPSDSEGATLQALFEAFSKAAELNPEPGEEGDQAQGEGNLVFDHGRCASSTSGTVKTTIMHKLEGLRT